MTSSAGVEFLVKEVTNEIVGLLPKDSEYARAIALRVASHTGLNVGWVLRRRSLIALFAGVSLAGFTLGLAADELIARASATYIAVSRSVPIKARVMLWPDGRSDLYVLEDRPSDPEQIFRVIRVEQIAMDRLQEIFGREITPSRFARSMDCGPIVTASADAHASAC